MTVEHACRSLLYVILISFSFFCLSANKQGGGGGGGEEEERGEIEERSFVQVQSQ